MKRLLATASILVLAACDLAPDYQPPSIAMPANYKEAGNWQPARPADDIPRGAWWKIFNNPELNDLEDQVTSANQNLKAALANYEQARDVAQQARADYFPLITADTGASRNQASFNTADHGTKRRYNDYLVESDLSYELDVWGKVRNNVKANEALADASKADLETISLSLHAELASDYFALRGDDAAQQVLDETVKDFTRALKLTQNQHAGGIVPGADVDTAQAQLESAKTQAEDMRLARAQLEHAIAVLVGKAPADFSLAAAPLQAPKPINLPGVPSTLLQQRPDIAAAERRVAASNAEIGVARTAYFPDFSLGGGIGLEAANLSHIAEAPSLFWLLGPSAALTIFDGGYRDAVLAQAHAANDEAAANYRQTVLTAMQQVEDNLAAQRQLAKEVATAKAAADASQRALNHANDRYTEGLITYLDVVVIQDQALNAKLSLTNVATTQAIAQVALIKALGGGWQQAPAETQPANPKP